MLTLDSAAVERLAEEKRVREHEEQVSNWLKMETVNSQYLLDEETDPTNTPRRMGRMMTAAEFERRMRRLLPQVEFTVIVPGYRFNRMSLRDADGQVRWATLYHADIMPERSPMTRKVEDVPDLSQKVLHRSDLPHYEFKPGHGYIWDPRDLRPGFKRVEQPWRPWMKGWRSILLQLIADGIVRIPDAEKHFYGPDNSPEWAQNTGRRPFTRPW